MAHIVWGIGIEPRPLTDRTQMCFYIIPGTGGSEGGITGGKTQAPRRPKGRRGMVHTQEKEGSYENR